VLWDCDVEGGKTPKQPFVLELLDLTSNVIDRRLIIASMQQLHKVIMQSAYLLYFISDVTIFKVQTLRLRADEDSINAGTYMHTYVIHYII
jgi:hypothetical protein